MDDVRGKCVRTIALALAPGSLSANVRPPRPGSALGVEEQRVRVLLDQITRMQELVSHYVSAAESMRYAGAAAA